MGKGVKSYFLLFHTNYVAELKKATVVDGSAIIDDKEYICDRSIPLQLKRGFGSTRPLYLAKWNAIRPMSFERKSATTKLINPQTNEELVLEETSLEPVDIEFYEKDKITPQIMKDTAEGRFLRKLGRGYEEKRGIGQILGEKTGLIIFFIIIFTISFIMTYMWQTGQLKF